MQHQHNKTYSIFLLWNPQINIVIEIVKGILLKVNQTLNNHFKYPIFLFGTPNKHGDVLDIFIAFCLFTWLFSLNLPFVWSVSL